MIKSILVLPFSFLIVSFFALSTSNAEEIDITNKTQIEIEFASERFADNKISQRNPNAEVEDLGIVVSESNARFTINPELGTKSDERDNCIVMRGDRRTGICEDGIYAFKIQTFDAAGNGSRESSYSIERDTVKPANPNVELSTIGYNVYARVKGETNSEVLLNGESANFYNLIDGESYQLIQNGFCETSYSFTFQLKDRASNISDSVNKSITTGACPRVLGAEDQTNYKDRFLELLGILEGSWGKGNYAPMGDWRGELHTWNESCKVWVKDYKFIKAGGIDARMEWSSGHSAAVVFYNPNFDKLFIVSNAIWAEYYEEGGPCGVLGLPKPTDGYNTERPAGITWDSRNRGVSSASYQRFEGGTIYWHWNNSEWLSRAHATYGSISSKYESAGGTWSAYGFPVSDVYMTGPTYELCQDYETDRICITQSSGSGEDDIFDFDLIGLQEIEIEPDSLSLELIYKLIERIDKDLQDLQSPLPTSIKDYKIWELDKAFKDIKEDVEAKAHFLFGVFEGAFNSIKDTIEFFIQVVPEIPNIIMSIVNKVIEFIRDPYSILNFISDGIGNLISGGEQVAIETINSFINKSKIDRFRVLGNIIGEFVPDVVALVATYGASGGVSVLKAAVSKLDDLSRISLKIARFANKIEDIRYAGVVIKGIRFTNRATVRLIDLSKSISGKSWNEIQKIVNKIDSRNIHAKAYILSKHDKVNSVVGNVTEWLGTGARRVDTPRGNFQLVSKDGNRIIRFDFNDARPHINIQKFERNSIGNITNEFNEHIYLDNL